MKVNRILLMAAFMYTVAFSIIKIANIGTAGSWSWYKVFFPFTIWANLQLVWPFMKRIYLIVNHWYNVRFNYAHYKNYVERQWRLADRGLLSPKNTRAAYDMVALFRQGELNKPKTPSWQRRINEIKQASG